MRFNFRSNYQVDFSDKKVEELSEYILLHPKGRILSLSGKVIGSLNDLPINLLYPKQILIREMVGEEIPECDYFMINKAGFYVWLREDNTLNDNTLNVGEIV